MRIKRLALLITILPLVLSSIAPMSAMADTRCGGGRGIQIWQDGNNGGPTTKFCANSNSVIAVTLHCHVAERHRRIRWQRCQRPSIVDLQSLLT